MPCREPSRAAAVGALALALAAAASVAAAEPTYRVHVEIALTRKAAGAVFQHGIGPSLFAPPNPSCTVPVGEQAREAYAAAASRMFRGERGDRPASLEIDIGAADLDLDLDGWYAQVEHALVLRSGSGVEIGRWTVKGSERVRGLGELAIPRAFRSAAENAARRFEAAFADPPGVARWLADSGVSVPRPEPPPDDASTRRMPAAPPRWYALYLDGGGGSYVVTETRGGRHASTGLPALAFRAGIGGPWVFVQLSCARTTELVDKVGVEVGPLLRLAPNVDLKVGWGVQSVSAPDVAGVTGQSVLAALTMAIPFATGSVWMRVGAEARFDFGASMSVPNESRSGSYQAAKGGSGWALVGIELGRPRQP